MSCSAYTVQTTKGSHHWGASKTAAVTKMVKRAVDKFNRETILTFRPKVATDAIWADFGNFEPGSCYTYAGRTGYVTASNQATGKGGQQVNLGWCSDPRNFGNVLHEMGHVSGMKHEHSRYDRNDYVVVSSSASRQYDKMTSDTSNALEYDLDSIMHYPLGGSMRVSSTASKGKGKGLGQGTLTRQKVAKVGQRDHLSKLDVAGIHSMYTDGSIAGAYMISTKLHSVSRRNDWHYVTITATGDKRIFVWKNKAGVSWKLTRSASDPSTFAVDEACPYYRSGYTTGKVSTDKRGAVNGFFGPHGELYTLRPRYEVLTHSTCEAVGLATIFDAATCEIAAAAAGKTITKGIHYGGYDSTNDGCSVRFGQHLFINGPAGKCRKGKDKGKWWYTNCECTAKQPCICDNKHAGAWQADATWATVPGKYSAGYATVSSPDQANARYTLAEAQRKCIGVGLDRCKAVTCQAGGATCTLRATASSGFKASPSDETSYYVVQLASTSAASMFHLSDDIRA